MACRFAEVGFFGCDHFSIMDIDELTLMDEVKGSEAKPPIVRLEYLEWYLPPLLRESIEAAPSIPTCLQRTWLLIC